MITSNLNELKDWFDGFKRLYPYGFIPNLPRWVERIDNTHQTIREKIGGIDKTIALENDNVQFSLDQNDKAYISLFRSLQSLIPEYLKRYNFNISSFLLPFVQTDKEKGMKIGKHVSFWMKVSKVEPSKQAAVNDVLAKLGVLWAKARTDNMKIYVTLSTDPRAFALIGHYGPDNTACFRQTAGNQLHKYIVAQNSNSFVIICGNRALDYIEPRDGKDYYYGRTWGMADETCSTYNLTNYYVNNKLDGTIRKCIDTFFEKLIGKYTKVDGIFSFTGAYANPGYKPSYSIEKEVKAQTFVLSTAGLVQIRCARCAGYFDNDDTCEIDGYKTCNTCAEKANVCSISGTKTFNSLYVVITENEKEIKVCVDIARDYPVCAATGKRYHKSLLIIKNGKYIYHKMADKVKMCPKCSSFKTEDKFTDSFGNIYESCYICPNSGIGTIMELDLQLA